MKSNIFIKSLLAAVAIAGAGLALAQQTVTIYGVVELSGTGATSGSNFDNGIKLAVKEINAAGGILGRPVEIIEADDFTRRRDFVRLEGFFDDASNLIRRERHG